MKQTTADNVLNVWIEIPRAIAVAINGIAVSVGTEQQQCGIRSQATDSLAMYFIIIQQRLERMWVH